MIKQEPTISSEMRRLMRGVAPESFNWQQTWMLEEYIQDDAELTAYRSAIKKLLDEVHKDVDHKKIKIQ